MEYTFDLYSFANNVDAIANFKAEFAAKLPQVIAASADPTFKGLYTKTLRFIRIQDRVFVYSIRSHLRIVATIQL